MAQDNEPQGISEGEQTATQVFWVTTICVVLFATAAFFILL